MTIDTKDLRRLVSVMGWKAINSETLNALLDELENERNRADGLQAELDELKRIEKD